MADVKRLNYFTSQFLVEKDFTDEQAYHMNMRRRHNQLLHTWGIADGGLQVTKSADKIIGISSGMAIDKDGRELVLLDAQSKDLTTFGSNADVYITAKYQEVSDPGDHYTAGGVDNYTRTTERPLVEAGTTVPVNDGSVIVLAKVKLDGGGNISSVDSTVRKMAGSAIDPTVNLEANSLSVTGNATVTDNVGIGTPTPKAKLQVIGGTIMPEDGNTDAAGILFPSGPGGGAGNKAWIRYYAISGNRTTLEIGASNDPQGNISLMPSSTVGIGTTIPNHKFHVLAADAVGLFESSGGQAYLRLSTNEGIGNRVEIANRPGGQLSLWTAGGGDVFNITKDGKVGIGMNAPQGKLEVVGDIRAGNSDLYFTKADHNHTGIGNTPGYAAIENDGGQYGALMILGRTVTTTSPPRRVVKVWDYLQVNGDLEVTGNIGTHGFSAKPKTAGWAGGAHTWDIEAEGTIWARNGSQSGPRDLAENYYSDLTLDPGDVVCLDRKEDRIVKSERANDDLIIGIISTLPGFLLGAEHGEDEKRHDGKRAYPVALSGRLPCKVTDENGPINRGDLLTSSSTIGHAMKATALVVGGVEIYAPGTIIGKALESFHSETGVIEVFVTLR